MNSAAQRWLTEGCTLGKMVQNGHSVFAVLCGAGTENRLTDSEFYMY